MEKEHQDNNIKFIHTTKDNNYSIWVKCVNKDTTSIFVTDPNMSVTYYIADFDGSKYHIKHSNMFNEIFLKSIKKKPSIIKNLLNSHGKSNIDSDYIYDLKLRITCFKRRLSIYTKKTIRKTKNVLCL